MTIGRSGFPEGFTPGASGVFYASILEVKPVLLKHPLRRLCDDDRLKHLIRYILFISSDMLSKNNYIVSYHINTDTYSDYWNPTSINQYN
uniref:Uncharacterized protein n=1 Tax=Utricularia reniformis TaxID=192314 RepID=A0A1Y0B0K4_9LAMI|nr:hypothetical protein AEK19_MT0685 [Utricularia reniformis]ART30933.1 hypothetical protein AEK19_MT0685 [Utricularia reniformis]